MGPDLSPSTENCQLHTKLGAVIVLSQRTMTGGNIAVVARGSTGCSIVNSSSPSADGLELDLSLLVVVFWVSALCRGLANLDDTLPL